MDFMNPAHQLTLEDITYEWLQDCTDSAQLKRAIKLIEEDGNYFVDLKRNIQEKLDSLPESHSHSSKNPKTQDSVEKRSAIEEVLKWQEKVEGEAKSRQTTKSLLSGLKQQNIPDLDKKKAENEKNKGNEAMTSGDLKEAVTYYTAAIKLDPTNAIYFGNRAMAQIKLKDYRKAIDDANAAIDLDHKYTKGFYRRAKANEALGNLCAAACDFAEILHLEAENKEVAAELDKILHRLNPNETANFELFKRNLTHGEKTSKPSSKVVKIQIEEEEDEEAQEGQKEQKAVSEFLVGIQKRLADIIDRKVKLGAFLEATKNLETLSKEVEEYSGSAHNPLLVAAKVEIYGHIAHCYKQSELEKPTIDFCSRVIAILEPKFSAHIISPKEADQLVEALNRRGLAGEALERLEAAYSDYHLALSVKPGQAQATQGLNRLSKHVPLEMKTRLDRQRSDRVYDRDRVETKPVSETPPLPDRPVAPTESSNTQAQTDQPGSSNQQEAPEAKELWANCTDKEREEISVLKTKGNDAFKAQKHAEAIQSYSKAIAIIEPAELAGLALHFHNPEDKQLYIDLLSNRSLANFYAGHYKAGFYDANALSSLAHDNPKVLYRRAINAEKVGEQALEAAKKTTELLERTDLLDDAREKTLSAITDFEQLLKDDPKNPKLLQSSKNCKILIEAIARMQEKNTKALELGGSFQTSPTDPADPEEQQNAPPQNQPRAPSKKLVQSIEQKTSSIAQSAIRALLEDRVLPKTSSQFETDISSLKGNEQFTLEYLSRFEPEQLSGLYAQKQLEFKTFSKIVTSLTRATEELKLEKSEAITAGFLAAFARTYNFKLTVKMLLKRERQDLRKLVAAVKPARPGCEETLSTLEKLLDN